MKRIRFFVFFLFFGSEDVEEVLWGEILIDFGKVMRLFLFVLFFIKILKNIIMRS